MPTKSFLEELENTLGDSARPNLTFFSYQVVSRALAPLRRRMRARGLTERGEAFVMGAAAYLSSIAERAWISLGYSVERLAENGSGGLTLRATSSGETGQETYEQSFARDMEELILRPPQPFPWAHGRAAELKPGAEPFPEELYLSGVFFMESPRANTNRPIQIRFGGGDDQFRAVKTLLVDQLLEDCAIGRLDDPLRAIAGWTVFPPLGMTDSAAQGQNMLAVVSLATRPGAGYSTRDATDLLRAFLRSQAGHVRDLAARCLFILDEPPRSDLEAMHLHRAFTGGASGEALGFVARLRWQLEGHGDEEMPGPEWIESLDKECCRWLEAYPGEPWRKNPIFHDKAYLALAEMDEGDVRAALDALKSIDARHPGNWFVRTLLGSVLMKGPDPFEGEKILREQAGSATDCPQAHHRLASILLHQSRLDEAIEIYSDCLARWPWDIRASEACIDIVASRLVE